MATAPRKKASPRPAATAVVERPAPLVDLNKDAFDPATAGRLFLFELDGTDYYIPDAASASVLAEVARLETEVGQGAAAWWLLGEFAGPDAVTALRGYKGLTRDHLASLYKACLSVLTGPKA